MPCILTVVYEPDSVPQATLFELSNNIYSNTVPSWTVPFIAIFGPLSVMLVVQLVQHKPWREFYRLVIALLLAVFITGSAVRLNLGCWRIQTRGTPGHCKGADVLECLLNVIYSKDDVAKSGDAQAPHAHTAVHNACPQV